MLQRAEEEVAHVIVGRGDKRVAFGVLPADVGVPNGEELLSVVVEEDDRCRW